MGESKLVSIEDLMQGNPRMCLSSLRVFGKCELCPAYKGCDSKVINTNLLRKMEERDKLKLHLKEIKDKIKLT